MFKQVKTKRIYSAIVEQVTDLIRENKLRPGDIIPPERVLSVKLGVSRPALREALAVLDMLGFIECRVGKGTIIRNINETGDLAKKITRYEKEVSPFELITARKVIETAVVRLAAQNARRDDIKELGEYVLGMESSTSSLRRFMKCDIDFHVCIAKSTGNQLLHEIVVDLTGNMGNDLWKKVEENSWKDTSNRRKYLEAHRRIFRAIKQKNPEKASVSMYDHLAEVERDLFEV